MVQNVDPKGAQDGHTMLPGCQRPEGGTGHMICLRADTGCLRALTAYEEALASGQLGMTESPPKCDEDGFYEPVQCNRGGLCRCHFTATTNISRTIEHNGAIYLIMHVLGALTRRQAIRSSASPAARRRAQRAVKTASFFNFDAP